MMKRQRGLGLLDVLFALALLGLIYAGAAKVLMTQKETNAAQDYRVRIEQVIEALQKYQYQQRTIKPPVAVIDEFPTELNDLVTTDEQFWINCSEADEAAKRCIRPDSVPWTRERIGYEAGHKSITIGTELRDVAYAQLTFPLSSSVIEPIYRAKWATELLKCLMPKRKPMATSLSLFMTRCYRSSMTTYNAMAVSLTRRLGCGRYITNAHDVTILNSDGTQKIVSQGLVDIYTVQHGDKVKPSCPEGTQPYIALGLGKIFINKDYQLTGSQKPT